MKANRFAKFIGLFIVVALLAACAPAATPEPQVITKKETVIVQVTPVPVPVKGHLDIVKERGYVICGCNNALPGFGFLEPDGSFSGFDVEFCRAVAAAVFDDPTKVEFRPLTAAERFTALQTGEVDVLIRNTTWTTSRDTSVGLDFCPTTFYDGQGIMVRSADNITKLEDLEGGTVCVTAGTTTELNLADQMRKWGIEYNHVVFANYDEVTAAYEDGRCDAMTMDRSGLLSRKSALSDPAAQGMPEAERLAPVVVANFARPTPEGCAHNIPVAKGIEKLIEARINNIPLGPAWVEDGWLVFPVEPQQLAVGDNLVGARVTERSPQIHEEILVERLELYVKYC